MHDAWGRARGGGRRGGGRRADTSSVATPPESRALFGLVLIEPGLTLCPTDRRDRRHVVTADERKACPQITLIRVSLLLLCRLPGGLVERLNSFHRSFER